MAYRGIRGPRHRKMDSIESIYAITATATIAVAFEDAGIIVNERRSFKRPLITPGDVEKVIKLAADRYCLEFRISLFYFCSTW
jgi:20S proteasome alpha/beta subunit